MAKRVMMEPIHAANTAGTGPYGQAFAASCKPCTAAIMANGVAACSADKAAGEKLWSFLNLRRGQRYANYC
eukprot:5896101-Amphidinium_carterae.1